MKKNNIEFIGLMLMCMLSINAYSQDESLFLATLSSEADRLTLDRSTNKSVDAPILKSTDATIRVSDEENLGGAGTSLLDGLSLQQFGIVLKDNFMGSYYYYNKLSNQQKVKVHSIYQRHPQLDVIRKSILKEVNNI